MEQEIKSILTASVVQIRKPKGSELTLFPNNDKTIYLRLKSGQAFVARIQTDHDGVCVLRPVPAENKIPALREVSLSPTRNRSRYRVKVTIDPQTDISERLDKACETALKAHVIKNQDSHFLMPIFYEFPPLFTYGVFQVQYAMKQHENAVQNVKATALALKKVLHFQSPLSIIKGTDRERN